VLLDNIDRIREELPAIAEKLTPWEFNTRYCGAIKDWKLHTTTIVPNYWQPEAFDATKSILDK
jgi:hypothetical protein